MKKIVMFLFLIQIISVAKSQELSKPLGNLKSMKKISNGIILQTDFGNLKALVYSANVIKIDVTKNINC